MLAGLQYHGASALVPIPARFSKGAAWARLPDKAEQASVRQRDFESMLTVSSEDFVGMRERGKCCVNDERDVDLETYAFFIVF